MFPLLSEITNIAYAAQAFPYFSTAAYLESVLQMSCGFSIEIGLRGTRKERACHANNGQGRR